MVNSSMSPVKPDRNFNDINILNVEYYKTVKINRVIKPKFRNRFIINIKNTFKIKK